MDAGIIGLGNLGTAIGNLIACNGYDVLGWEYNSEVVMGVNDQHTNTRFLPGVDLHSSLRATSSLGEVLATCPLIFIALPSVFIQPTLDPQHVQVPPETLMVNMAKGIDASSGLTTFQTLTELFPRNPRVMLSGPTIANEFARQMPTVVVLAGESKSDLLRISRLLDNEYFRTRFSEDAIGVELGGVLKNIYAIGLGLLDGKQVKSINFRAVYLTLAMEEITRVGVSLGAKIETFLYLAGVGDLLATSLSEHSHNRRMGELLAQGLSLSQVEEKMGVTPEGFNTLRSMLYIGEKMHVAMPLAKGLWDVIQGRTSAEKFIASFIRDFVE